MSFIALESLGLANPRTVIFFVSSSDIPNSSGTFASFLYSKTSNDSPEIAHLEKISKLNPIPTAASQLFFQKSPVPLSSISSLYLSINPLKDFNSSIVNCFLVPISSLGSAVKTTSKSSLKGESFFV